MHATRASSTLDVIEGTPAELAQAGHLVDLFPQRMDAQAVVFLVGFPQERIELSDAIYRVLRDAVTILSRGDAIVIGSVHQLLTTTETANLLGISRQYVIRLIGRNELQCEMVGRHRRLHLKEVLAYRERRAAHRRQALDEMTVLDEELGAYD
ncbi:MAG TPA: helix-turn-helix domain-containing protein [Candidatus Baltobacteraceae bacterium]|jgi:excisionase family DNA binding protein|nr:helix-turn-helix domain-containing protein [Candidatus Baltobacteraceae bacterium]